MDRIVSNATPLIYLAKASCLDLLKGLYREVFISQEVKREVVERGKKLGKRDAFIIEKAINEGWIKVSPARLINIPLELDPGEMETISLAKNLKIGEVLIDEAKGRIAAKLVGLVPRGTVYILLESLKNGKMDFVGFLKILDRLIEEGFRLREEVYIKVIKNAKHISEGS
ncbi:MAG: DUF3368 domain-containing protein [Candidatus Aenigmarchaeota archaeon]|nr:DUF3368 domain-containing protein [Candidatus Aenigmarchaeota archaeon]